MNQIRKSSVKDLTILMPCRAWFRIPDWPGEVSKETIYLPPWPLPCPVWGFSKLYQLFCCTVLKSFVGACPGQDMVF